jgi:hypothetical protein
MRTIAGEARVLRVREDADAGLDAIRRQPLDVGRPGSELERLAQKGLRIFVHLTLEIHQPQIVVGVERRLSIIVQSDGFR